MEYFKTKTVVPEKQPLAPNKAAEILNLLKAGYDETTIFNKGFHTYHIEQVKDEFLKVKDEVYKKVKGEFVLIPEVPAVTDEEGKEITPAIAEKVYEITTKTVLQDSLAVDKLEAVDVLNTVVAWDENPDEPLTYLQFVAKYKPVVEKVVITK